MGRILTRKNRAHFRSMGGKLTLIRRPKLIKIRSKMHPFMSMRIVHHYCRLTRIRGTIVPIISMMRALHRLASTKDRAIDQVSCGLIRAPRIFSMRLLRRTCTRRFAPFFASSTSIIRTVKVPICLTRNGHRGVGVAAPFSLGMKDTLLWVFSLTAHSVGFVSNMNPRGTTMLGGRLRVCSLRSLVCCFPCGCVSQDHVCCVRRVSNGVPCVRLGKRVLNFRAVNRKQRHHLATRFSSNAKIISLI